MHISPLRTRPAHWKSNFPLQPRLENVRKLKTKQISERSPRTKGAGTSCPSPSTFPSCSTFVTPCLTPWEGKEEAAVVIGKDEEEEEEEEGTDGSGGTGVEAGDETDVGTTAGTGRGSSRITSTAPPPGPSSWQSLTGRRGTGSSQLYNRRRQGRRRPQEPQLNSRRILRTALPPPPQGLQGPWGSGGGRTRRCLSWPTSRPPRRHPAKPADRDPVCQGGTKKHQENQLVLQEPSLDLRRPRLLPLRHLQLPQPQQVCPIRSAPASSSTTPTRCLTTSLPS